MKKLSLINFLFWINHPRTREIGNPPSSPFVRGGITTPPFSKGRLGGIFLLTNIKGISVIFLIIAMLLMVIIGYVFSYLIPSKQKSVVFPIQSTQAFFIAQSGVEFAVRFATDNSWTTPVLLNNLNISPNNTRNLGAGSFTITYINVAPDLDTLISVGEVPAGTERRRVRVSNFTQFLGCSLMIDPTSPVPCDYITIDWALFRFVHVVRFYISSSCSITLDSFQSTWTGSPGSPRIRYIRMAGTTRYGPGSYNSGNARTYFSSTQTISPAPPIMVEVQFNRAFTSGPNNMHVIFYSTSGQAYDLNLDPEGDGLPSC